MGKQEGREKQPDIVTFLLSVPVKEVLPGVIKQGVNCLESQGQNTAGDLLLGMGICRGSAKSPPPAQVSCLGLRTEWNLRTLATSGVRGFSLLIFLLSFYTIYKSPPQGSPHFAPAECPLLSSPGSLTSPSKGINAPQFCAGIQFGCVGGLQVSKTLCT